MIQKLIHKKGDIVEAKHLGKWKKAIIIKAEKSNIPYNVKFFHFSHNPQWLSGINVRKFTMSPDMKLIKVGGYHTIVRKDKEAFMVGCTRVTKKLILELADFYINKK